MYQHRAEEISIEKISSKMTIGNTLDIQVRQSAAGVIYTWVTVDQTTPIKVKFEPGLATAAATYNIVLETFDNNSSVKSAILTDQVAVEVIGFQRAVPIPTQIDVDPTNPKSVSIQNLTPTTLISPVSI